MQSVFFRSLPTTTTRFFWIYCVCLFNIKLVWICKAREMRRDWVEEKHFLASDYQNDWIVNQQIALRHFLFIQTMTRASDCNFNDTLILMTIHNEFGASKQANGRTHKDNVKHMLHSNMWLGTLNTYYKMLSHVCIVLVNSFNRK